jgi:hypothetical protein
MTVRAARRSCSPGREGISGRPPAKEMRFRGSGVAAVHTAGPRIFARALTMSSMVSGVQYDSVIGCLPVRR